jgi:hypothetical protein
MKKRIVLNVSLILGLTAILALLTAHVPNYSLQILSL